MANRFAALVAAGLNVAAGSAAAPAQTHDALQGASIHTVAFTNQIPLQQVGQPGPAFVASVNSGIDKLTDYSKLILEITDAKILAALTIVEGIESLGFSFAGATPEQIAGADQAVGLHFHASQGVPHPVVIIPEKHAVSVNVDTGEIEYADNAATDSSTIHEVGHNTLNYLGNKLDSPVSADGRKDFAYSDAMQARYLADVRHIVQDFGAVADTDGSDSEAYQAKLQNFSELAWMLPPDIWQNISAGAVTANMEVNPDPAYIQNGTKEALAQSLANANVNNTTAFAEKVRDLYTTYFPNITQAGSAIDKVLNDYAAASPDTASFDKAIENLPTDLDALLSGPSKPGALPAPAQIPTP